ncbi:glycosyltransferase [Vagococcus fluvialis]|uniref:glycosyltransferase n=1 Tax=Vagococcus fluvialis TaxID=2738 RepID=UPI003B5A3074
MKHNIEFLVSTMNCKSYQNLYCKMNIKADAIIINQGKNLKNEVIDLSGYKLKGLTFEERGVGISRNSALMRATNEICVMSDDDMVYTENARKIIEESYLKYPDADMIVFNVIVHQHGKKRNTVKKNGRVRLFNSLRYGTVTFTFRRAQLVKYNLFFSLEFGGGAKYGSGEDSIFIWDVLKRGLKVYSVNETIANVYNDDSSWFTGYNEKYFLDRGALFKRLSNFLYPILIIQFVMRKRQIVKLSGMTKKEIYNLMMKGARNYGGKES